VSEKVGNVKGTQLDEEFQDLEKVLVVEILFEINIFNRC
jgi:hypothetical protein